MITVFAVNAAIVLFAVLAFLFRNRISGLTGNRSTLVGAVCLLLVQGIVLWSAFALKSSSALSGLNIELYKIDIIQARTVLGAVSFILLFGTVPVFLHFAKDFIKRLTGKDFNPLGRKSRLTTAAISAAYLVLMSATGGFRTEESLIKDWAESLAIERDMRLERRLQRCEDILMSDPFVVMTLEMGGTLEDVRVRIESLLLGERKGEYSLRVGLASWAPSPSPGESVGKDSRFHYEPSTKGHCRYFAYFPYYSESYGVFILELSLDPVVRPGLHARHMVRQTPVPQWYCYAKYEGLDRQVSRGNFAYPTVLHEDIFSDLCPDEGVRTFAEGGYRHFISAPGENVIVIISRPKIGVYLFLIEFLLYALVLVALQFPLLSSLKPRRKSPAKSYYKKRISAVVMLSLVLTLALLSTVSVLFVINRNEENSRNVMSEKINTIRSQIQSGLGESYRNVMEIPRRDLFNLLRTVGADTNSELTLYRPDGKVFMSLVPTQEDGAYAALSNRMVMEAFEQIAVKHKAYCITSARIGGRRRYSIFAPVFASDGRLLAVVGAPYHFGNMDFRNQAVLHSVTILTVFLALLLLAYYITSMFVDGMLRPLSELEAKMKKTELGAMDPIPYDRQDELSSLVDSYNRMVTQLAGSTARLAQAERDKAWSEMARQVAHEIKNPLTPMKLQIQRLMRMKANGDPGWMEKFEEASRTLLDHIDILSETAAEFSTFAHLYAEEPVEIRLDALILEEMAMFSASGVKMEYIGLEDITVLGPKPQLTRVLVNLLGNAVQACPQQDGKVVVSVRNSSEPGFFDISVEDNGAGVSEENVGKLFTPNFTTKSGGTGLGLAISRSVLEKCGATIDYSRSILLNGACFTVRYPRG